MNELYLLQGYEDFEAEKRDLYNLQKWMDEDTVRKGKHVCAYIYISS